MIIRNYDGRGNSYDTDNPLNGNMVSLFSAYGSPDTEAYEAISGNAYTTEAGNAIYSMTPAEAFIFLNDPHSHNGTLYHDRAKEEAARNVLKLSRVDFERTREEARATANQIKEKEKMSNKKTIDFFEDLKTQYKANRAAYESVLKKAAEEREDFEEIKTAHIYGKIDEHDWIIAQANHIKSEKEYSGNIAQIRAEFNNGITALRSALDTHIKDYYTADPAKLDPATIDLLKTGICTAEELTSLADRNKDNPVMLRVIGKYANDIVNSYSDSRDPEATAARILCSNIAARGNGERETEAFNQIAEWANRGIDDSGEVANRAFDSRFDAAYSEITANIG